MNLRTHTLGTDKASMCAVDDRHSWRQSREEQWKVKSEQKQFNSWTTFTSADDDDDVDDGGGGGKVN